MVVARVNWRHTFHGGGTAGIAFAVFQHEHVARAFLDRIFGGVCNRLGPTEDGAWIVTKALTRDGVAALQALMEPLRTADDHCFICANRRTRWAKPGLVRHEFGDTAHSIDTGVAWEIDFGEVDHPNQQVLPAFPK